LKANDLDMLMYFKTPNSIGRNPPRELYREKNYIEIKQSFPIKIH